MRRVDKKLRPAGGQLSEAYERFLGSRLALAVTGVGRKNAVEHGGKQNSCQQNRQPHIQWQNKSSSAPTSIERVRLAGGTRSIPGPPSPRGRVRAFPCS